MGAVFLASSMGLTPSEFEALTLRVDPKCDGRTVQRLFGMCGEETNPESGERAMTPRDFVALMKGTGYGRNLLLVTDMEELQRRKLEKKATRR